MDDLQPDYAGENAELPISLIDVSDRLRALDEDAAEQLAVAIGKSGLIQAITVRPTEHGRFELVAGRHRLRAHEILGREVIRCFIRDLNDDEAENVEVEENLFRGDLTKVERIKSVGLWVRSYRAANPDVQHGGDRKSEDAQIKFQTLELERADQVLAKKMGRSKSSIYDDLAVFDALGLEVLDALATSEIADNAGQLKALAALGKDQQLTAARGLADGTYKAVKEYRIAVGDIEQVPVDPESEWTAKYTALWQAAKPAWRKRILKMHEAGEL